MAGIEIMTLHGYKLTVHDLLCMFHDKRAIEFCLGLNR